MRRPGRRMAAPSARARILYLKVLTPVAWATVWSSLNGEPARPVREFCSRYGNENANHHSNDDQMHEIDIVEEVFPNNVGSVISLKTAGAIGETGQHIAFDQNADDLTKTEGHDRQIVTAQAEDRQAEEDAGQGGGEDGDHNCKPEIHFDRWCGSGEVSRAKV